MWEEFIGLRQTQPGLLKRIPWVHFAELLHTDKIFKPTNLEPEHDTSLSPMSGPNQVKSSPVCVCSYICRNVAIQPVLILTHHIPTFCHVPFVSYLKG